MIAGLFTPCARDTCDGVGLIRVDVGDEKGEVWANICIMCLPDVLTLLREMNGFRKESQYIAHDQEHLAVLEDVCRS